MSAERVKNRWLVVVGAVVIQLCLGAIYAWGTFVPTLTDDKATLVKNMSPELLKLDKSTADELAKLKKSVAEVNAKIGTSEAPKELLEEKKTAETNLKNFCTAAAEKVASEVWKTHFFAFSKTAASGIFSAGLFTFALVMIMAGRWQDKAGPRVVALTGGVVLGVGYTLASFTGTNYWAMFVLIGIVGGAGIGLGYVCPIAACVKWFPDMKGFITGMAVAGFGAGAYIFVKLGGEWANLISDYGVNATFLVFGIIFLVAVVLGALLLSNPPAGWKPGRELRRI